MSQILGIGTTHYPPLIFGPSHYDISLRTALQSPLVPDEMKDPSNWPEPMQAEWANRTEMGELHQQEMIDGLRKTREVIDDFNPDAVIIFGDDQYENFREDIIPPFSILCMDEFYAHPLRSHAQNVWNEPRDKVFNYPGAGLLAKHIATELIDRDFPIPYAYKPAHFEGGIPHAFANGLIFLDWDRKGWTYPIIPISVNCYGPNIIWAKGGLGHFRRSQEDLKDPYMDFPGPGGPSPRSCFQLGRMIREIVEERSERVIIMASSSWAHGFLNPKDHYLHRNKEFDDRLIDQLRRGDQRQWANITNAEFDEIGGSEFKNWICLAGAMEDRTPEILGFTDTWLFNSAKCFAAFHP